MMSIAKEVVRLRSGGGGGGGNNKKPTTGGNRKVPLGA
jgi:hypothetical protein